MRLNKIANRFIAICTVSLLIFSLNVTINVSAGLVKHDSDGIAYDNFDDASDITLENCTYDSDNNSVILEYAPLSMVYDHDKKPNNIEAWEDDQSFQVPEGDFFTFFSTIRNPDRFKIYEFEDLTRIDAQDDQYLETRGIADERIDYVYPPLHLFEITIEEDIDILDEFRVNWWPGPHEEEAYIDEIVMYIWGYGDLISRWHKIGNLVYTLDNINNDSIASIENAGKYISEDGTLNILIVGKPTPNVIEPAILSTDYINVSISTDKSYNPRGYVLSDTITPSTFYGWESVRWESTRPTDDGYIKLQITDSSGNPLKDDELDGNSNGFSTSPLDLSSLGASRSEIRLKALLYSDKYTYTPRLYSWVVLWQTTKGFFDSFSYEFRINQKSGVKIDSGEVTVSEFYSEWPLFGKNPANTRSYIGTEVEYEGNKTYWQSNKDLDIGGWFRSPIMSNGKVYIGSNDKKIYAYNVTYDSNLGHETKYTYSDSSDAKYEVETSVAVDNDYVIVGTSTLNSKNKIYALNSTNLSHELWEYTISGDNTICYTAAPTISDGKVYITSWSGKFANSPIISNLYSKLNELLGYKLLDNKLITLDITSGNEIWEPIDLPAGGLSTPAVDNGIIYVGCSRIEGGSAFAYDEDTGSEIWNASIGSVGRASPVVVDGEDGKIVIFIAREQTLFSYKGTDKVVALNAEDGSMLWNVTIGNQSTVLRSFSLSNNNFTNLQATAQPAATPAVFGETVYVMATNGKLFALDINTGEEKWVFEESMSSISLFASASPVVVDDNLYIISQGSLLENAQLFVLNTANGAVTDNYYVDYENYLIWSINFASPIVTDGLIIVSFIEPGATEDYKGHLICFGEHTKNKIGKIYSVPIHVQSQRWWDEFNADYTNTTENTITFSILDEEGTVLMTGLNGAHNNISSITQNIIQLCAELNIGNYSDTHPVLNSWGISWTDEKGAPEFIDSTFIPSQEGWINLNLEECSIEVEDLGTNGIISGLDVDSAKFDLEYKKSSGGTKTDTFDAVCEGESGDVQVKVIANLTATNIDVEDMVSIMFKIKDLASNQGNSSKITFTIDSEKPSSYINDSASYLTKYNEPVAMEAIGSDDSSGVKSIALYYRPVDIMEWIRYRPDDLQSDDPPYIWEFENDTSDEYEFCTIAIDKAGNVEDFPDELILSFLFDMNVPSKPSFADEYSFNQTPEFTDITFADDYELESIEYRLNTQGINEWTNISRNVNDKIYKEEWSLSEDDWDDLEEDIIYYLYFRVTDLCGNEYTTPTNDEAPMLIKDVSPPVADNVTFDLSDYDEGGWDDSFTITANIPDDTDFEYVSLLYSYSSDNKEWSGWKSYGEKLSDAPFEWDFKAEDGSGYYKFKTLIFDAAGNAVESPEETVSVTLFPTTLVLVLIILIFVVLMFSIFVVIKMKKKPK